MVRVASFHRQTTRPLLSSASYSPAAIEIGGSTIRIEFAPGDLDLPVTKLIAWVSAAAGAVTDYYGRFPVGEARILIIPVENREGVLNGTSWGTRPAFTRIYLGELTNDDGLKNDWVMTHEMVHYAFPSVSAEHHWIEEGIATYVEPIARLEAGQIRAVKVWGDLVNGVCLLTSESDAKRTIVMACATRFAQSSLPAGIWRRPGSSRVRLRLATGQSGCRC